MTSCRILALVSVLIFAAVPEIRGQEPKEPIPVLTDADRAAAFPNVDGHAAHDRRWHSYVLFDQLEWRHNDEENAVGWDARGWIGGDVNRLWFRSEAKRDRHQFREAEAEVFYGRAFSRWWDFVAGVRQDVRPGPGRTWAAVGVQGLAPYFFELQATAYVGASGRTQGRIEAEYEMLLTNRLVLRPSVEVLLAGKSDPARGIGRGLVTADAGLRLRYEIRREFAPYIGVEWNRRFGSAEASATQLTAGLRFWF
jgi:copper resistance protein B